MPTATEDSIRPVVQEYLDQMWHAVNGSDGTVSGIEAATAALMQTAAGQLNTAELEILAASKWEAVSTADGYSTFDFSGGGTDCGTYTYPGAFDECGGGGGEMDIISARVFLMRVGLWDTIKKLAKGAAGGCLAGVITSWSEYAAVYATLPFSAGNILIAACGVGAGAGVAVALIDMM